MDRGTTAPDASFPSSAPGGGKGGGEVGVQSAGRTQHHPPASRPLLSHMRAERVIGGATDNYGSREARTGRLVSIAVQ